MAAEGDAEAQFALGTLYALGMDADRSRCEALRWLEHAATQNHTAAQYNVFLLYEAGDCGQDTTIAAQWLLRAATAGHPEAQYTLGYRLMRSKQAPGAKGRAINWLRKAAEQGHAKAQAQLGYCLAYGAGIERDYSDAGYWFTQAASSPDAPVAADARRMKRWIETLEPGDELRRIPSSSFTAGESIER